MLCLVESVSIVFGIPEPEDRSSGFSRFWGLETARDSFEWRAGSQYLLNATPPNATLNGRAERAREERDRERERERGTRTER